MRTVSCWAMMGQRGGAAVRWSTRVLAPARAAPTHAYRNSTADRSRSRRRERTRTARARRSRADASSAARCAHVRQSSARTAHSVRRVHCGRSCSCLARTTRSRVAVRSTWSAVAAALDRSSIERLAALHEPNEDRTSELVLAGRSSRESATVQTRRRRSDAPSRSRIRPTSVRSREDGARMRSSARERRSSARRRAHDRSRAAVVEHVLEAVRATSACDALTASARTRRSRS